jgi:CRP-like cAMP-binding protein
MAYADPSAEVRHNKLLAALPECELERLQRSLQPVFLRQGQVLYEPGAKLHYAYFPATAIVSLEYLTAEGVSAEFAIVGNDGLVGIALFMGGDSRPNRAIVQMRGWAYRLTSDVLTTEFARGGVLQHVMLLYTQALITLTAQTVVCNRHHSVDQQVCRWLLLALDRLPSSELTVTQDLIANMLGVRRESVTGSVSKLQRLGVISHSRGHITVLDRPSLESLCCECYAVVKKETDRLVAFPHR